MDFIKKALPYFQLVVSILLITSVLLQSRGAGVGGLFGGSDDVFRAKRGVEKFLFGFTIFLAVLFIGGAILNLVLATR